MRKIIFLCLSICWLMACNNKEIAEDKTMDKTAADILAKPNYQAICYGGYRLNTRQVQPSITEIKEDLKILSAMGIRILRTYNVHLPHAANVLKAIDELQQADPSFEMYVMLGAWIDCKNAWTDLPPIHEQESERNASEIDSAVSLANTYPHIVKIIAVGNEAMIRWAEAYYVEPITILKWVEKLQSLKKTGQLPKDIWITSSDNFAAWGGGDSSYHTPVLEQLLAAVDYVSVHTYPMHDTHYNPAFWGVNDSLHTQASKPEQIEFAMNNALTYAQAQFQAVKNYMQSLGIDKPVHIGETGWASYSNELYGATDSKAVDELKAGLYYKKMSAWTQAQGITCFYFEAFDEPWKDADNPGGSENNFGLFTVDGQAKYALWDLVDQGVFDGLDRDGIWIEKTYDGSLEALNKDVLAPPVNHTMK